MRRAILTMAYGLAALVVTGVCALMLSPGFWQGVVPYELLDAPMLRPFLLPAVIFSAVIVATLAGAFAYLAWRPWWWGKLLLAGLFAPWAGFSAVHRLIAPAPYGGDLALVPGAAATLLLGLAVVCQVADPRFSGRPLGADQNGR